MVEAACDIHSLSFSPWSCPTNTLIDHVMQMFTDCNILQELNLRREVVKELLGKIQNAYNHNPFHGWSHAVSVTQMMYMLISRTNLSDLLNTKEKLSLFIAALCHDLDHPGLSNAFQINSKSHLANLYGNKSVLENHHYAVCMKILHQQESKVFAGFDDEEKQQLYANVRSLILGTDMANHFHLLSEFDKISDSYQWSNPAHRSQFLVMLMKAADISNEARPFPVSKVWADALMEEYFAQSDLEKAQQLPVTPFMDRDKVQVNNSQIGFIDSFLLPTFKTLHKIVPEFQPMIDIIIENRKRWTESA